MVLIELDGVAGRGHPARLVGKHRGVSARHVLLGELGERDIQLGRGEAGRQDAPEKARVLVLMAKLGEFLLEKFAIVRNGPGTAGVEEPAGRVEADLGLAADRAGPELDARQVAFADRPQAHDEPDFSGSTARLVGMRDDRRIEQGRGLERVLLSEIRSDQLPSCAPDLDFGAEPVRDEPEVLLQGLG